MNKKKITVILICVASVVLIVGIFCCSRILIRGNITRLINKTYKETEHVDGFDRYTSDKLETAVSLDYYAEKMNSSSENLFDMVYNNVSYTYQGMLSGSYSVGELLGKGSNLVSADDESSDVIEGSVEMAVYEIPGVDCNSSVAVKFEDEEETYLYVNLSYSRYVDAGPDLLEYLESMGFTDEAEVYVKMEYASGSNPYTIYCADFSMTYVMENIFSPAKEIYDTDSSEGYELYHESDETGLSLCITSSLTGAGFLVKFMDNGCVVLLGNTMSLCGTPDFTLVLDLQDKNLSAGTDLIKYVSDNYKLLVAYES